MGLDNIFLVIGLLWCFLCLTLFTAQFVYWAWVGFQATFFMVKSVKHEPIEQVERGDGRNPLRNYN